MSNDRVIVVCTYWLIIGQIYWDAISLGSFGSATPSSHRRSIHVKLCLLPVLIAVILILIMSWVVVRIVEHLYFEVGIVFMVSLWRLWVLLILRTLSIFCVRSRMLQIWIDLHLGTQEGRHAATFNFAFLSSQILPPSILLNDRMSVHFLNITAYLVVQLRIHISRTLLLLYNTFTILVFHIKRCNVDQVPHFLVVLDLHAAHARIKIRGRFYVVCVGDWLSELVAPVWLIFTFRRRWNHLLDAPLRVDIHSGRILRTDILGDFLFVGLEYPNSPTPKIASFSQRRQCLVGIEKDGRGSLPLNLFEFVRLDPNRNHVEIVCIFL